MKYTKEQDAAIRFLSNSTYGAFHPDNSINGNQRCVKCNELFVPRLVKPLTICENCSEQLRFEINQKGK